MGVYIEGMEMPKNCICCPFGIDGWCHRQTPSHFTEVYTRRKDCPLVKVFPVSKQLTLYVTEMPT